MIGTPLVLLICAVAAHKTGHHTAANLFSFGFGVAGAAGRLGGIADPINEGIAQMFNAALDQIQSFVGGGSKGVGRASGALTPAFRYNVDLVLGR